MPSSPVAAPAPAPTTVALPGPAPEPVRRCADCGGPAPERFCPRCGQEQDDRLHRSMRSILGELLDSLAGWDAKIPRTLWLLVARPGMLTAEYLAGRRTRYLKPLRLYLTLSVVCLVAFRFEAGDSARSIFRVGGDIEAPAPAAAEPASIGEALEQARAAPRGAAAIDSARMGEFLAHRSGEGAGGPWQQFKGRFKDRLRELSRMPVAERERTLRDAFVAKLGNMFFVLLPVFAAILHLLYRRRPLYYAEHFVFALHAHAAATVVMTLALLIPGPARLVPLAWLPVHVARSLRRVYGGTWPRTLVRFGALSLVYSVALFAATFVTSLIVILVG